MTQNCNFCDNADKKKCFAINRKTRKCKRRDNHCDWNCLKNIPYVFENHKIVNKLKGIAPKSSVNQKGEEYINLLIENEKYHHVTTGLISGYLGNM